MAQYMILIYAPESAYAKMTPDEMKKDMARWGTYTQEMVKAGIMRGGAPLKPVSTATTLRTKGGKVVPTDGPFAETKEQLGGYYLVDVPDLDSALTWAGKCPGITYGPIEVRPVMPIDM